MKIGPLNNKQVGNQQGQAKLANVRQLESGYVGDSADSNVLNERKRLAGIADRKQQVDAARFERSSKSNLSVGRVTSSYTKKQIESGRLEQVKKRIRNGFYDQKDVVLKIASSLVEKLDLENEDKTE